MIWTLLFLFPLTHAAQQISPSLCYEQNLAQAERQELWNNERWLGIVHFREGLFKKHSQADGAAFFISPQGDTDAKQELTATIKAFCENTALKTEDPNIKTLQAHCLFPAREQLLESFGLGEWPKPFCPILSDWRKKIGNKKISLVFSSYYAHNPSSVFGHTLLRVDREQESTGQLFNPLLSYGINFAGQSTTSNPGLYALYGMMGGFKGVFTSLPYYYKVREYSDFDARDLWEYELKMSEDQKNLLLNHLWEEGFTHFNYYYFTENCSYHLLTSLDVALPERHLDQEIPYWVIPIDTVKAVTNSPGLVTKVTFRPSLFRQYKARLSRLEERHLDGIFYRFVNDLDTHRETKDLQGLSAEDQAYVLDTILDYWDFKHTKELYDPKSAASAVKMEFLRARAPLPEMPPLVFDQKQMERPDLAHETFRAAFNLGHEQKRGAFQGLDLRFALHDFLDAQQGYPKNAQIDFFHFKTRYFSERKQFRLTEARLFDVELLTPWKRLESAFSWRSIVAFERQQVDCSDCMGFRTLFQGGGAVGLFRDRVTAYILAGADFQFAPAFQRENFRAVPEISSGLKFHLPNDFNFSLEGNYFVNSWYGLPQSLKIGAEGRKSFHLNDAVGIGYSRESYRGFENEDERISYFHYF
jgi:hypothetical protein